ncbi:MAG: hypothetical protein PHW82_10995 [Bacteroidales bacterium]|nr:hypothetical protein [Bacteroidales bacterium]
MEAFRKITLIQRNLVLIFYIIICIVLISFVWMLFYAPNTLGLEIPYSVIILIVAVMAVVFVVIGSYFYLIVALPDRLSRNFDIIKNKIASGEINTEESFAHHVIEFIIKQFDFVFLDVEYAAIGIADSKNVFFNDDFPKEMFDDYAEIFQKCRETEDVISLGSEKHLDKKVYKYVVPIHFGNRYLGFIIFLTNQKLSRLFQGILADFENFYIDDQLLHVLNYKNDK